MENSLKQSLLIFDRNWLLFLTRPIVVTFLVLTVLSLFWPVIVRALSVLSRGRAVDAGNE